MQHTARIDKACENCRLAPRRWRRDAYFCRLCMPRPRPFVSLYILALERGKLLLRLLLVHPHEKRYYGVRIPRITSTGVIKPAQLQS